MRFKSRRIFLQQGVALAMAPALPAFAQSANAPSRFEADITPLLKQLTGGNPIVPGRVEIDIPSLAENGQSVNLRVAVPGGDVKSIHIFAPRNPRPNVGNFFFGPKSAKAELVTRIRLGGTQTVRVVAAFADGSFGEGSAPVEVTSSACLDAST